MPLPNSGFLLFYISITYDNKNLYGVILHSLLTNSFESLDLDWSADCLVIIEINTTSK